MLTVRHSAAHVMFHVMDINGWMNKLRHLFELRR